MAQIAKTIAQAEIRSSPDKFYGFFNNNVMQLTSVLPNFFKSGQLLQGQENCVGSVMLWKYVLGRLMSVKLKIDAKDGRNRSVTYKVIDGDIMQVYNREMIMLMLQGWSPKPWMLIFSPIDNIHLNVK